MVDKQLRTENSLLLPPTPYDTSNFTCNITIQCSDNAALNMLSRCRWTVFSKSFKVGAKFLAEYPRNLPRAGDEDVRSPWRICGGSVEHRPGLGCQGRDRKGTIQLFVYLDRGQVSSK